MLLIRLSQLSKSLSKFFHPKLIPSVHNSTLIEIIELDSGAICTHFAPTMKAISHINPRGQVAFGKAILACSTDSRFSHTLDLIKDLEALKKEFATVVSQYPVTLSSRDTEARLGLVTNPECNITVLELLRNILELMRKCLTRYEDLHGRVETYERELPKLEEDIAEFRLELEAGIHTIESLPVIINNLLYTEGFFRARITFQKSYGLHVDLFGETHRTTLTLAKEKAGMENVIELLEFSQKLLYYLSLVDNYVRAICKEDETLNTNCLPSNDPREDNHTRVCQAFDALIGYYHSLTTPETLFDKIRDIFVRICQLSAFCEDADKRLVWCFLRVLMPIQMTLDSRIRQREDEIGTSALLECRSFE